MFDEIGCLPTKRDPFAVKLTKGRLATIATYSPIIMAIYLVATSTPITLITGSQLLLITSFTIYVTIVWL